MDQTSGHHGPGRKGPPDQVHPANPDRGVLLRADLSQSLRPRCRATSAARRERVSPVLGHPPCSLPLAVGGLGGKGLRRKSVSQIVAYGVTPKPREHTVKKYILLRAFYSIITLWL